MKSNQSFFNKTVFKKNLTRFAPCWGLYTVGALLGLLLLLDSGSGWMAANLVDALQAMGMITPIYALVCTQLLFGDLYNTRMCNALHALPLRRETWFATNVLSGFVFHLIPTGLLTVIVMPILAFYCPDNSFLAAPIFFLGVNLQFAFFFALAVFCAFCAGSRLAQGVVYGIANFAALIAGWLVDTLYIPMFHGIEIEIESFFPFSPIANMMAERFVETEMIRDLSAGYRYAEVLGYRYHRAEGFGYYFLVAAVGIVLFAAALWLYRRRKLESAGDFIAVKVLEPVFLVIYSMIVGALFQLITNDIFYIEAPLFIFLGIAVGWFTGKMLLERSTRVFSRKSFLRCGGLMGVFLLTLALSAWDPFGIVTWLPEAEKVKVVRISDGNYSSKFRPDFVTLTEQEDIEKVIGIHRDALKPYEEYHQSMMTFEDAYAELVLGQPTKEEDPLDFFFSIVLTYQLHSGRMVTRYYDVWMKAQSSQYILELLNTPEAIFGMPLTEEAFVEQYRSCIIRDTWEGQETYLFNREELRGLYRAILADCEAKTMTQHWDFHRFSSQLYWMKLSDGTQLDIFSDCENTLNWLRDYGLDVDALLEEAQK